MDSNAIFSARITNPATGAGAWVDFPIHNEYYLDDILQELGLQDNPWQAVASEFQVSEYIFYDLPGLQNYASLDELNYLAHVLNGMDDSDLLGFGTAVQWFDEDQTVRQYINTAYNLDAFFMTAGMADLAAYGKERRHDVLHDNPFAEILGSLDDETLGRMLAAHEKGRILDGIYVQPALAYTVVYEGSPEEIPEEFRVLPEGRNYLRNAEMDMEQSTGMIDGIINNLPLPGVDGEKPSIAAMLEAGRQASELPHASDPTHSEPEP